MGIFSKKKKPETMDLPPPPSPEEVEEIEEEKRGAKAPEKKASRYKLPPPPHILLSQIPEKEIAFKGDIPSIRGTPKAEMPSEFAPLPEITQKEFVPKKPRPFVAPPEEVEEVMEEKELEVKKELRPIFVEIGDYKAVLNSSKAVRNTLKEAEDAIIRLGSIKAEEERIISDWQKQLEDIEKKISYVDEVVFGGE